MQHVQRESRIGWDNIRRVQHSKRVVGLLARAGDVATCVGSAVGRRAYLGLAQSKEGNISNGETGR